MRCEVCQGSGYIFAKYDEPMPCAECNAYGFANCCEGLREQPEPDGEITATDQGTRRGPPSR